MTEDHNLVMQLLIPKVKDKRIGNLVASFELVLHAKEDYAL